MIWTANVNSSQRFAERQRPAARGPHPARISLWPPAQSVLYVFKRLEKSQNKNISWHAKINGNSNVSVHINLLSTVLTSVRPASAATPATRSELTGWDRGRAARKASHPRSLDGRRSCGCPCWSPRPPPSW